MILAVVRLRTDTLSPRPEPTRCRSARLTGLEIRTSACLPVTVAYIRFCRLWGNRKGWVVFLHRASSLPKNQFETFNVRAESNTLGTVHERPNLRHEAKYRDPVCRR